MNTFPFVIINESAPHIGAKIFVLLDKAALLKCRSVSKIWRDYIDSQTDLWSQISFSRAIICHRLDICKLIVTYAKEKNQANKDGWTSLHLAAQLGQSDTCK